MNIIRIAAIIILLLTHSGGNCQSVVFPLQQNVLIKGIPNYLSVGLKGIAADSIELSAHHSKLEKRDNWNWYITPDTGFKSETVIVKAWKRNKLVSVDSTEFRLKWSPDPSAFIGGHTGEKDSCTKEMLVASIGLVAYAQNFEMDVLYNVVFFAMRLDSGPAVYLSNNAFLTELMKSIILKTNPGDRVVFYGIKVKYPDGRIKTVSDITITIK